MKGRSRSRRSIPEEDGHGKEASGPILSQTKIVENASRLVLEEAVQPWMVTHWHAHDLGIDAIIEVTRRPFGEADFRGTGKRFAVQLKATEGSLSQCGSVDVPVDKVYYWHEATEPSLLVTCHLPTKRLFHRWIDDDLIRELDGKNPQWREQKTVAIRIDTGRHIGRTELKGVESYVRSLHRVPRQALKPGAYLKALKVSMRTVEALLTAAKGAGFGSVQKRLEATALALRNCTYEVALTGPSRAGKSTLINALLGEEISPVDKLPTTAVAIRALPGERGEAEVIFRNGKRKTGDPSAKFLAEFATQSLNEDNRKEVDIINVRLVNPILEQGLSFLDAPGLHDPSPEIRAITAAALDRANAVIYVLEVASAASGGFSLPGHVIDDIKKLQGVADRLFLVLNKADALDDATRKWVESYIVSTLKKYGIWAKLPHEPIFLSAQEAWKWRSAGSVGTSPCKELEDVLWAHLLESSATGAKRLALLVQETGRAGQEFLSLLATRRLSSSKAAELEAALTKCIRHQDAMLRSIRARIGEEERWAEGALPSMQETLTGWLRRRLEGVPLDKDLPDTLALREEIQGALIWAAEESWKRVASRLSLFASQISKEIEVVLQQARLTAGVAPSMAVDTPSFDSLEIPSGKTFEEAVAGMLGGGLIGMIFGGWGVVIGLFGGLIAGFLMGRENQREREIEHILKKIDPKIAKVVQSFGVHALGRIRTFGCTLEEMVNDRIGVFVHDARTQLKKTGKPLSLQEAGMLTEAEAAVRATMDSHEKDLSELLPMALATTSR